MFLSDSLAWALNAYDVSAIKVICKKSSQEKVARVFTEAFSQSWRDALERAEAQHGDYDTEVHSPDQPPAEIVPRKDGFLISVGNPAILYRHGDYYDIELGLHALKAALDAMKEAFPAIQYEGCIECALSDVKSGEAFHCDFSTENVTLYDFIGEALGRILSADEDEIEPPLDYFWEILESELSCNEDYEETLRALFAYAAWIETDVLNDAAEKIMEIAEDAGYDDTEALAELLDGLRSDEEEDDPDED